MQYRFKDVEIGVDSPFQEDKLGREKRVCQNSFSAKDSYHFVKNNRYQRVNNSMITVTLIFMRE